ncbi:DUF4114 domain-containing protein [Nostoc sp.]|uniref:DUF4114 domain-containing protein n=1 Tax=Nostoc sp. TaxID=1180 RepID=UPI002FFAEAC3
MGFDFMASQAGTYYVRLISEEFDPATEPSFNVQFQLTPPAELAQEPLVNGYTNDFLNAATDTQIQPGGVSQFSIQGAIGDNYELDELGLDVDLYKITLQADEVIYAIATQDWRNLKFQTAVRIFDSSGKELAADVGESNYSFSYFQAPAAGTYYVGVSHAKNDNYDPFLKKSGVVDRGQSDLPFDVAGQYNLLIRSLRDIPTETPTNDTLEEAIATTLAPDNVSYTYTGIIGDALEKDDPNEDQDWFTVVLRSGDQLQVNLNTTAGLIVELHSQDGTLLLPDQQTKNGKTLEFEADFGGTYYVVMQQNTDLLDRYTGFERLVADNYELALNLIPRDPATLEPQDNDSIASAINTNLSVDTTYEGTEEIGNSVNLPGSQDIDYYKVQLDEKNFIAVEVSVNPQVLDPLIELYDDQGQLLANQEGFDAGSNTRYLEFVAPKAGNYYVAVTSSPIDETEGDYNIKIQRKQIAPPKPIAMLNVGATKRALIGEIVPVVLNVNIEKLDQTKTASDGFFLVLNYDTSALQFNKAILPDDLTQDWEVDYEDTRGQIILQLNRKSNIAGINPFATASTPLASPLLDFNQISMEFVAKRDLPQMGNLLSVRQSLSGALLERQDLPFTIEFPDLDARLFVSQRNRGVAVLEGKNSDVLFQLGATGLTNNRTVNESGIFLVDDQNGTINGISPDAPGYLQAALERSQVLLASLFNLPNGYNPRAKRLLDLLLGQQIGFYVVVNNSTDAVLADLQTTGQTANQVFLSTQDTIKLVDDGMGNLGLNWQGQDQLSLNFQASLQSLTQGITLQNQTRKEVLDLRQETGSISTTFTLHREANYDNTVSFYKVVDAKGTVVDPLTGERFSPDGDRVRYADVALKNQVDSINLSVAHQSSSILKNNLMGGAIYAPFIIVNGGLNNIQPNFDNVYFAYLRANSDKLDHIRLLGDNLFGFEDLKGGGDRDFNDLIVQINFSTGK